MNDIVPTLPPATTFGDFFRGLVLPFRAVRVMLASRRLVALSVLSGAVTSALLLAIVMFLWPRAFGWAEHLIGTGGWRTFAATLTGFLFFVVSSVIAALTLPNLILAPLQDPLSEATDERCGGFQSPPFELVRAARGTLESLAHTLLRLGTQLLGLALLFPLNLLPGVGSVLWAVAGSTWSMFCLSVEHLSNPMARHVYPFGQVLSALRRRLPLALGFGAALQVLLWVPVLNFFLMPVAVVSGTLLFRALRAAGDVGPPPA